MQKKHKNKIDYIILITVIILSLFGLLMVYSASNVVALDDFNDQFYYVKRQGLFLTISFILMYFFIYLDLNKLKKIASIIFIICLLLLFIVLIPGIGVVRGGARSWISILGFSIQPSEFMKIGLIILYAKYLSKHYNELNNFKNFMMLFSVSILVFLIIMLQPDFGTGLVIVLSSLILVYISGVPIKYFIIILSIGLAGMAFLIISAPYRLQRITAFLNPWEDPLGSGFQGIQSLFAITPGGLFGHGFNQSIQKHFFLPEPQNDFIFAIILEEFGLIGGAFVLLGYFIIIYRSIKNSININDNFQRFLGLGLTISLFVQVFINIGVVIGLLPVTGITLPLFSYGGSSLIITMCTFALIINISRYQE